MLKVMLCAAALAACAPAIAAAQSRAPSPAIVHTVPTAPPPVLAPVDAAAFAEAQALLRDMDYEAQMERTAAQAVNTTFDTTMRELQARLGEEVPAELTARVRALLMEHTARVVDDLRPVALDAAARIYARYFTADELREIRRIQTNPVMIKLTRVGPQLLPELMQVGVAAGMRREPQLMADLRRVIEQWESEHANSHPPVS